MMKIYVFIIILFHILVYGVALGRGKGDDMINTALSLGLYLPILGRILGWW